MKTPSLRAGLGAALLFAILTPLPMAGSSETPTTVDTDGHFSAKFPDAVTRNNAIVDKGDAQVVVSQISATQGASAFEVTYIDYPEGTVAQSGVAAVLKDAAGTMAANTKGIVRWTSPSKTAGIDGIEVLIDASGRSHVLRARLFAVGDRVFEVSYDGPRDSEAGKAAVSFLDSFRILP